MKKCIDSAPGVGELNDPSVLPIPVHEFRRHPLLTEVYGGSDDEIHINGINRTELIRNQMSATQNRHENRTELIRNETCATPTRHENRKELIRTESSVATTTQETNAMNTTEIQMN